ncbi:MAG: hypothetical protein ACTSU4_04865 [Promethearchaeota archaeon]
MSETLPLLMYIKNMLADLIYINSVIALELLKITENTAALRRGEDFFNNSACKSEHEEITTRIMELLKKYKNQTQEYQSLKHHFINHE